MISKPPRHVARRFVLLGGGSIAVAGCSIPARLAPVPQDSTTQARIPKIPNARYFPDSQVDLMAQELLAARKREAAYFASQGYRGPLPEANLLAVSGGGANGAFGAGLLTGWTEAGTRPPFKLVTGVSTGALTAPFAFLGSSWDPQLAAVYTGVRHLPAARSNCRNLERCDGRHNPALWGHLALRGPRDASRDSARIWKGSPTPDWNHKLITSGHFR